MIVGQIWQTIINFVAGVLLTIVPSLVVPATPLVRTSATAVVTASTTPAPTLTSPSPLYSTETSPGAATPFVCNRGQNPLCLTATPGSGPAPLAVTFALTTEDNFLPNATWTIDFGDGTQPMQFKLCSSSTCSYSITHTYQKAGAYEAALSETNTAPWVVIGAGTSTTIMRTTRGDYGEVGVSVGGVSLLPHLSSISPSTVMSDAWQQVTVRGTGFFIGAVNHDEIVFDGDFTSPDTDHSLSVVNDTTLTFDVPRAVWGGCGSPKSSALCEPAESQLSPGQHTVEIQNENGTSNALTITIQASGTSQ